MKKIRFAICALIAALALGLVPPAAMAIDDPGIDTTYAAVLLAEDGDQETVLYTKNADERLYPASLTKVMTVLLAVEDIESGKIALSDPVTAQPGFDFDMIVGGSSVYIMQQETMTLESLLYCAMVASANDACNVIAQYVSGSISDFVARMNARAAELGMTNTSFRNACGLDTEEHLSTARDVATLSCYILNTCPELLHYTGIWTDSLRNGQTQLVNTNKLLKRYSGITGLKTGTTSGAGVCISASATRDGLTLIAVILGSPSSADRFNAATTLLDYGFAHYAAVPVPQMPDRPLELAVKGSTEQTVPLDYSALPSSVLLEKGARAGLRAELTLPEALEAPVQRGQSVGKVEIYAGDTLLSEAEVTAAADAPVLTFGDALELLWQSLLGA